MFPPFALDQSLQNVLQKFALHSSEKKKPLAYFSVHVFLNEFQTLNTPENERRIYLYCINEIF